MIWLSPDLFFCAGKDGDIYADGFANYFQKPLC